MAGVDMVAGAMERGLLMLKPALTMADTMAVITAKGLPRLVPTTAAGVGMVATTERGLLMLRLPPTMAAGVDMVATMERGPLMPRLPPTTAAGVDTVATTERGLPPTTAAGVD